MTHELRRKTVVLLLPFGVLLGGCLDQTRLNAACEWSGDSAFAVDRTDRAHRRHLIEDAQLAEALGIRYGDSFRQTRGIPESIRLREECTARTYAAVGRMHGVDSVGIAQAAGGRNPVFDIVTMYLPLAILFLLLSRAVARRVCGLFDPDDRVVRSASLVVMTPVMSAILLGLAQVWSWNIESLRLRDGHISYRIFRVPTFTHGWYVAGAAALIFGVAAVREHRRTRSPAAAGRHPQWNWRRAS